MALWLDADVLVMRTDEDIADHLHPHHFQASALEHVPFEHRLNPNTGVWLMRSRPEAFSFLDAVSAAGRQPGPWSDQGAVLAALGWRRGDAVTSSTAGPVPGLGSPFLIAHQLAAHRVEPALPRRAERPRRCYNSLAGVVRGASPGPAAPTPCTSWE